MLNATPCDIDRPWKDHPHYRGMSDESAAPSWAAHVRKLEREQEQPADASDDPPFPTREQFDLPADGELLVDTPSQASASPRFRPIAIDDVSMSAEPAWAIQRLLPARGLACIVGAPKCGKSFLATDALFAVARGVSYAGRDTLQGPVIYATGEGVSGFKRRLIALRRHHGVEGHGVPFFMIESVPDLGSEQTSLAQFIADLEAFIADRGLPPPRAIALDTLARCMGSGDENAAKDMGRLVDRCGALDRHFGCLIVLIHHTGKDETRKGRGSNSLNGAADVTWEVKKLEGCSRVRIEEMKDGPEGVAWNFRLQAFDIGPATLATSSQPGATSATSEQVAEGSETVTCVVEILTNPAHAQPAATKSVRAPTGVEGDLLKVIRRAIEESGEQGIAGLAAPANVRGVTRENLKRYCQTMAWQTEAPENSQRAMLSKNLSKLRARGLIDFDKHAAWIVGA